MSRLRLNCASAVGLAAVLSAALASGCGGGAASGGASETAQRSVGTASQGVHGRSATATGAGQGSSPAAGASSDTGAGSGAAPSAAATGTSAPGRSDHARRGTKRAIPPAHPVPVAFEPAPGAASDAEIRSELAQMAAVERAQREQSLSAAAANLEGLLPWTSEPKSGTQVSVASVFTDYGLGLACGGVLGRNQLGVAHKTAPCGTLVTFTYARRSLTVPVIDRGPYIAGREWDLTGATAAALGFPGLGKIEWSLAAA
jgi:Lytic transglycolase